VSSNLMALCLSSVGLLLPHVPKACSRLPPSFLSNPVSCLGLTRLFEGHSAASDVLRELFKTIQPGIACQAELVSFFEMPFSPSKFPPPHPFWGHVDDGGTAVRTALKNQNNQTPDKGARSTQLLNISHQLQWLGFGFRSALASRLSTAIKHLDCAPSFPWQAAPGL